MLVKIFFILFTVLSVLATAQNHALISDKVSYLPGFGLLDDEIEFAGYSAIDSEKKLFYWFHGSCDWATKPTLLWSNGGPGYSSLWGFFLQNGPFEIDEEGKKLTKRKDAWSSYYNYLIFEHPLSVTLSFAKDLLVPKTPLEAVNDLYRALCVFLDKHPEISKNPIILAGQSYAATYLTILADLILEGNKKNLHTITISKIVLISPWIDPYLQMSFDTSYAYNHGLISQEEKKGLDDEFKGEKISEINDAIASICKLDMANIGISKRGSFDSVKNYINNSEVRKAIHVDPLSPLVQESYSAIIEDNFKTSVNTSYSYLVQKILDETDIPILIVSGLNDGRDTNFLGVQAWLDTLKGQKAEHYFQSPQLPWIDEASCQVMGFIKGDSQLKYLKVLNAGHSASMDQPLIINEIK